ncbi:MAG: nitrite/sulfite reductase [Pseudomonadales bacterium]|nr:nitrite/sulfite reductase [Pseudomonadales bacterium]
MYRYDATDKQILSERVTQFRDQTKRFLAGELSDNEFLPLRLQNGLYIQRLAPMLRVAVPYGLYNSTQMRQLAHIARHYDKGYAHVSTRQNFQFNWPHLEDVPDILADLAQVDMHAIQTSGNCVRNITTDQYAGVAADEIEDPRPWCELLRQWSTFHPEFALLPRKFKIAVCATRDDRAAFQFHDIGVELKHDSSGQTQFDIYAGGGLGRTPVIAQLIRADLPWQHLLTYIEAILRVYNMHGNRENKFKARIKILVRALGVEAFREKVEKEWDYLRGGENTLDSAAVDYVKRHFVAPDYEQLDDSSANRELASQRMESPEFGRWLDKNIHAHRQPGYAVVNLALKPTGISPGDISDSQMDQVADLADEYSFGEMRNTHNQNIVFADVKKSDLYALWQALTGLRLATPNLGYLSDPICCPGGDYCALANAKSIPIAEAIQRKFDDIDYLYDLGPIDLNISGCMNACGHHHVGNIGILGVDKKGEEFYQLSLGGSASNRTSLGKIMGPAFAQEEIPDVIEKIMTVYREQRLAGETFIDTYDRVGMAPFKERVYVKDD